MKSGPGGVPTPFVHPGETRVAGCAAGATWERGSAGQGGRAAETPRPRGASAVLRVRPWGRALGAPPAVLPTERTAGGSGESPARPTVRDPVHRPSWKDESRGLGTEVSDGGADGEPGAPRRPGP